MQSSANGGKINDDSVWSINKLQCKWLGRTVGRPAELHSNRWIFSIGKADMENYGIYLSAELCILKSDFRQAFLTSILLIFIYIYI